MAPVCPRPCGRLATAAILISVGVVQLVAGLILLRSKYVYLLSAPNFWTAATNFAVGGLLGISASVWKETQKASSKHTTRRHLLASLVGSSLLMNATTAAILVLGEGNALLSIQLEKSSNATFASELLAYAYATSVCSPIVCIVVACIFLSGLWFRRTEKDSEPLKIKNISKLPKDDDAHAYSWVFRQKLGRMPQPDPTILRRALSTKHLSSSTEDDEEDDQTLLHRSNSLPSVDGSLLHASTRTRARSDSNLVRKMAVQRQKAGSKSPHSCGRHKVSFVDEFSTNRIPHHFARQENSYRGYREVEDDVSFESGSSITGGFTPVTVNVSTNQPSSINGRNASSNIEVKRSKDVSKFTDVRLESRREHSVLHQSRPDCESFHTRSVAAVDVHRDGGRYENEMFVDCNTETYENSGRFNDSAEESTLVYEADSSSSEVFGRFEDSYHPRAKSNIRRSSTEKTLKYLEDIDNRSHETVRRTSTAIDSNYPAEFSVQDYDDTELDQIKANRTRSLNDASYSRKLNEDSNMHTVDASFEIPTTSKNCTNNSLAGEVIPIKVSTLPRKLPSKLVPVSIPVVSGTGKYSLKSSDKKYIKNINESRRRVSSATRKDKFNAQGEPKLLSFRGGAKPNPKEKSSTKENRSNFKENKSSRSNAGMIRQPKDASRTVSPTPGPSCPREDVCPSPAHTSGYMSSLEDTLDSSGKTSSTVSPDTAGTSMSGMRGRRRERASLEPNTSKEVTNPTNYGSSEMHSKKELIDQLLRDPSFHKIMMQSIKETDI